MTIENSTKRLKILDTAEIQAFYEPPIFSDDERLNYFTLSAIEETLINPLNIQSRIYCILELGYFKASQQFFEGPLENIKDDLHYVHKRYYPRHQLSNALSHNTLVKIRKIVLSLCDYQECNREEKVQLEAKIGRLAKVSSKPTFIFREVVNYLQTERLVMPAYSYLQDVIGHALEQEKQRLISIARSELSASHQMQLQDLLANPSGLYEITQLKRSPKDFGYREMQREIERGDKLKELYDLAKNLMPQLELSNEGIRYYASLINYYSVFRLQQLDQFLTFIYLLCFIFYRYQRFQDNLIGYFIYQVRQYNEQAKDHARETMANYLVNHRGHLRQAGQVLQLFTDDSIPPDTPFEQVKNRAFGIIGRSQLQKLANEISFEAQFDQVELQWLFVDQKSVEFKRRLRRIIRTVTFTTSSTNDPLLKAVSFLKNAINAQQQLKSISKTKVPLEFIPTHLHRYLLSTDEAGGQHINFNRYEFLVYRFLRNRLESGDAFCQESIRYRSFEDDLLTTEQWGRKNILIKESDLPILQQPIRTQLEELENILETRLLEVNGRISEGENRYVEVQKLGKSRKWSLVVPRTQTSINHPFFDVAPLIDLQNLMHVVDLQTSFLEPFDHILHRYAARSPDKHSLVAALVAWGTNMGLGRMGKTSNIDFSTLNHTSRNFIRLETLQKANDLIVDALAQLPIFSLYNINDGIHSSSDGQKFETRLHTINARHSPKYFGLQKGIVAYSMVANHVPINARVIGANEHESHYVFDILYNNSTAVRPNFHSTDTHGSNEVNFALLYIFGYQFAPRYRDIYDTVKKGLYGFQHPSQYGDYLLKPVRKINKQMIINEWENIQRIILSLSLKSATQSVIISKLSSFARRNRTKQALWEYDNIIRSIYLLNYIDSLPLRRNVQQALNRGESYHQLRRAVSYANFGKLRYKSEADQQIWNECGRLIANAIIYFNASLLSRFYNRKVLEGDVVSIQSLSRVSPVAWQHINFHGRFEFLQNPSLPDLDLMVDQLVARQQALEDSD